MTSVYLLKKWCSTCGEYKETEKIRCDKCKKLLRNKPRSKRFYK